MLRLTKRLKKEIEAHAQGSLYRMNAGSADCYAFSLYRNEKGRVDFEGGWDWSKNLVDTGCSRLYILNTREFIVRKEVVMEKEYTINVDVAVLAKSEEEAVNKIAQHLVKGNFKYWLGEVKKEER